MTSVVITTLDGISQHPTEQEAWMPRPAINAHSHDLKVHLKDSDDAASSKTVPVFAWCDEGYPLILDDAQQRLIRAQDHPHFQCVTWPKVDTAQYVAAEPGWRALLTDPDGNTSARPVVMWRALANGQANPIVLEETRSHGKQQGFDPMMLSGWSVHVHSPKGSKTG